MKRPYARTCKHASFFQCICMLLRATKVLSHSSVALWYAFNSLFCIYKIMFAIFGQTRHRGVNPVCSMSTSEDNNNGVGVKADTLCSTGANVKVNRIATEIFRTTDQQSHPSDKEPLGMSNR